MTQYLKGAAKRLTFSLVALSALSGCAVYGPAPGVPYAYGTDANGQIVYAVPPVYAAPYYDPYFSPAYIGPPVFFNFGFWGGGRGGRGGGRGGHGGGGHGGGGHR
ncbi:hypothetical protein [Polaromonas sp. SM01]|uniref:hypothetical protein n=1 Tax=Polaromonas sp. SM01 TaxID=3085630 RepID=UPI00298224A5|nr:hypothetical protein [Polaromonas sp. SM01]MDW5442311.1 hypothetical protein [Polaromonas sp. SM01]